MHYIHSTAFTLETQFVHDGFQLSWWINSWHNQFIWYSLFQEKQPFHNLEYKKLVKDPIQSVRQIYDQYGFTFTPEVEERMRNYLKENFQHKDGVHTYSLEEWNLTAKDIKSTLGPYVNYFKKVSDDLI